MNSVNMQGITNSLIDLYKRLEELNKSSKEVKVLINEIYSKLIKDGDKRGKSI